MEQNPFANFNPFSFIAGASGPQLNLFNPLGTFNSSNQGLQNPWQTMAGFGQNTENFNAFETMQKSWIDAMNQTQTHSQATHFFPNQFLTGGNQTMGGDFNPWASMGQDFMQKYQDWQKNWQQMAMQQWQQNLMNVMLDASKQNAKNLSSQMGNIIADWKKYDLSKFLFNPILKDLQAAVSSNDINQQKKVLEQICKLWLDYSKTLQRLDIVSYTEKTWLIQSCKKMIDDTLAGFEKIQSPHFANEDQQNFKNYLSSLSGLLDSFTQLVNNFSNFETQLNEKFIQAALSEDYDLKDISDLFNLWCAKFDECYNEQVFSDNYKLTYSKWINNISDFKIASQKIIDQMVEKAGLPSNREMNTVHKRLHQVFKDTAVLKKEIAKLTLTVQNLTKQKSTQTKK